MRCGWTMRIRGIGLLRIRISLPSALAVALLIGCASHKEITAPAIENAMPRKIGPRLYRGDLDGRRGLLFYAASPSALTVVYDTVRCGLYEVWRGPVPVPDTGAAAVAAAEKPAADAPYGPQGPLCHRQQADTLWRVSNAGVTLAARPRFLGLDQDSSGYLSLHYALDLADGKSIRVDESPAYDDHYGDVALRQEFRFQGIEPGMLVSVRLGGEAYAWHELWSLSANGALTGGPGAETLVTGDDGVSAVKLTFEGSVPQGAAP